MCNTIPQRDVEARITLTATILIIAVELGEVSYCLVQAIFLTGQAVVVYHPLASNPSQLDSTEGVWGHDCGTIYCTSLVHSLLNIQKYPQWEADVRLARLSLMQEYNGTHQDWNMAGPLPSFFRP